MKFIGTSRFAPMLFVVVFLAPAPIDAQEPVRIALREVIVTSADRVTLGELATFEGGDSRKRNAMAALDLDARSRNATTTIDRNVAMARLLIAGFEEKEFNLTGSPSVHIQPSGPPLTGELLVDAIREHVAIGQDVDPVDVEVVLLTSLDRLELPNTRSVRLEPLDHSDLILGQKSVLLGVFDDNRMVDQFRVSARTSVFRHVLVAQRPIERGETLDLNNAFIERRSFENGRQDQWLGEEALGKSTSHRIQAQQTIRPLDLARQENARDAMLIKSRDIVSVIAGSGQFQITMSGMEALKSGKAGDTIPLRNPVTRAVIYGRIVDAKRVEVSY